MEVLPDACIECANRAEHFDFIGNDVAANAPLDAANRDDGRAFGDIELPAWDRLERRHDLCGHKNRVHTFPRRGPVCLTAFDVDLQPVGRGKQTPGPVVNRSCTNWPGVQAEYSLRRICPLQYAFLNHQLCAAFLAGGRTFLSRLEEELYGARYPVPVAGQHFGSTHQNRHMRVMAAGMHDTDLLAVVFGFDLRCKRQTGLFCNGQGIHVGAQRDRRAGPATFEDADDARIGDAGSHLVKPEPFEVLDDFSGGFEFAVSKFRVLMNVTAPANDFRLNRCECVIELVTRLLSMTGKPK